MTEYFLFGLVAVAGAAVGAALPILRARQEQQQAQTELEVAKRRAKDQLQAARDEADSLMQEAKAQAQTDQAKRRQQIEAELTQRRTLMQNTSEQLQSWESALQKTDTQLQSRAETLVLREQALTAIADRQKNAQADQKKAESDGRERIQQIAGETFKEARQRLITEWTEQVRAEGSEALRQLEQNQNTPEFAREGRRMLDVASQRYHGHYLTERLLSNLPIEPALVEQIAGANAAGLEIIGEVANVKLALADDHTAIRLEGQDSFGREIARRALSRFTKHPPRGDAELIRRTVQGIAEELDRETVELGRRAFRELEIPRAHPDIVKLVGRLNFRTSYSQNQWKHAIEAAFLCGMLASELRLDVKIARRAALMHDIGKSLTHAIDGSHAVIGADFARRLGESELVANAIGAHHLDEPFNSAYALLVAAGDAMSGARPGARHEQEGSFVQRVDDLERLVYGVKGVERVYALQAGREVRIHVKENEVDDLRAAQLSSELAAHISDNLTFPGQIKVTVIREVTAVAVAN